jgi:UDP-2-acetamido-2-deoxy-ribo-hexuluronate aminotransferase
MGLGTYMKFIDLGRQYQEAKAQIQANINAVLEHGAYIKGPEITELEKRFSDFCGAKHSICLSSGTTALQVALMALDVGPGDEVIVPAFSFFATTEVILLLGATPIFADIDPFTYNLNPQQLSSLITDKTKAIIPVSLYGVPADFDSINAIAKQHNIAVIDDAAQSFGATLNGRGAGSLATITATSFFPSKPLGCYGDGGAVFTDDDDLAEKMRLIICHGESSRYNHTIVGINGRMATLQAAVLLAKLDIFPKELELRAQCAAQYAEKLAAAGFTLQTIPEGVTSAYAQYTVRVGDRAKVQSDLSSKDIPTAVHYPKGMHLQQAYTNMFKTKWELPNTELASKQVVSLPFHPYLQREQIDAVCAALVAACDVAKV